MPSPRKQVRVGHSAESATLGPRPIAKSPKEVASLACGEPCSGSPVEQPQHSEKNTKGPTATPLSGLVAGDSPICGRLAALILRLRPAGLRFEEFRSPVKGAGWACDSQIAAG